MLPVFRKAIAFWKILRLRSLILLVRATSSVCGMILLGEHQSRPTPRNLSQRHFVLLRTTRIYIQWHFLRQTAAPRCEVFPQFRGLTPSPSSGCACGLVDPKLLTEDEDEVSPQNFGKPSHLDAAVCPRKFLWILSPRKLQDLYESTLYTKI